MYNAVGFYNYRTDAWKARTGLAKPPVKFVWNDYELNMIENEDFVNWEDLALRDALLTNHTISYLERKNQVSIPV